MKLNEWEQCTLFHLGLASVLSWFFTMLFEDFSVRLFLTVWFLVYLALITIDKIITRRIKK